MLNGTKAAGRARALWLDAGIAALSLAVLACDGPLDGSIGPEPHTQPRVLLIGIDGMDLRWIERLGSAGRLPTFDTLMKRGVVGALETVHFSSPVIWTSVATGVNADRHGVGGFLVGSKSKDRSSKTGEPAATSERPAPPRSTLKKTHVLPSGRERPATVAHRVRPAFWNILSHYGKSVGVLAWWATYPAERVNGYMISPYLLFQVPKAHGTANVAVDWSKEDPAKAFPAELGNEVGPMMYKASDIDVKKYGKALGIGGQTPYTPWVLARDRSYYEATLHTLRTRPVDCVAVYFQGPDVASHDFTYYVFGRNINKQRRPRVKKSAHTAATQRVEAMYEYVDELVGGLLEQVGEDTDVIIVSDHGWEYDGTSHWNLNPGVFIAAGPSFRKAQRVEGVSVIDITPIILTLFEIPLARAFDGKVPAGVLIPEIESQVTYVDDYPIPAVALAAEADENSPEDENMLKLLRGLGYIEE